MHQCPNAADDGSSASTWFQQLEEGGEKTKRRSNYDYFVAFFGL
jgi:hypothetical protein